MLNIQKRRHRRERKQQREDAELLGTRLAYESGIHWLDANVKALEALRTRSLAFVSAVLLAVIVVARLAPEAIKENALGSWGLVGIGISAVGMLLLFGASVWVSWPVKFTAELGPLKIIEKYVYPSLEWPSAKLYKALAADLDGYVQESRKTLAKRARLYCVSLLAAGVVVIGAALFWADAIF